MKDLFKHILGTYHSMRLALCVLGFAMPLLLMGGGRLAAGIPAPTHSMSAYYHLHGEPVQVDGVNTYQQYVGRPPEDPVVPGLGTMRNCFVGLLFAIGVLLYTYKGFSAKENVALNIGGFAAWGVALLPMGWPPDKDPGFSFSWHFGCAGLLFLCIGYVCIFRSTDTLPAKEQRNEKEQRLAVTYQSLGWLMWSFPVLAWVFNALVGTINTFTFYLEAVGVYIFAAYWLVKSRELRDGRMDNLAACGALHRDGDGVPLLRSAPLQERTAAPSS